MDLSNGFLQDVSDAELQDDFDIKRYLGTWYEIAKTPNFFEVGCSSAKARYELINSSTISVVNTCLGEDGKPLRRTCEQAGGQGCQGRPGRSGISNTVPPVIRGRGIVVDPRQPAALRVTFPGTPDILPPNIPNYLVHKTDYKKFAVVGDPQRMFLFILARAPRMSQRLYKDLVEFSAGLGYNTDSIIINTRDGCPVVVRK